ncbi:MAG TPA: undecaprenyl-diphosphate phosphatase [Candidatus Coproplasma excrementigallinarum]|uniref:Undecaprenyl-diphosphatase n=1 Tax=Candidatus Coproplasma excrementigallinarum TaxID=2840747 RepID=A0A9D1MIV0_9FIRM|nr:undecaprenyl-diphosphate phosphatase [Candidatus Coproplasma excrementigallinarum]
MTFFQALILGLVQGLTEFLPISSSGHLVLVQRVFNIDLQGADMLFDLFLHLGTLFAVLVCFRRQVLGLFRRPYKKLLWLIFASIPAALVGFLLGDLVERYLFGGAYLAAGFALTAVLLAAAQVRAKRTANTLPLKAKNALFMGVMQAVAVIPGISRSGATVAAGIISGADREEVADFSFLMSIPVIAGGFAVTLIKGIVGGELSDIFMYAGASFGFCVAISVFASALAGFAAIKLMLKSISSARYTPFIIYLILLAILCVVLKMLGVL